MRSQGKYSEKELLNMHFEFNVMTLGIFGMCFIKRINILNGIREYYITPDEANSEKNYAQFVHKHKWIFECRFDDIKNNCYKVAKINDNMDVCIQIKSIPEG